MLLPLGVRACGCDCVMRLGVQRWLLSVCTTVLVMR